MKSKRGAALITVVIVFAVLMVMGFAVLAMSLVEAKQVVFQENQMKAYYAARSGADAVAAYLIENPSELDAFILKTKTGPATGAIGEREFEVYVTGTEHEFIIESIAYYNSVEESKVYLTMKEYNLMDAAIFADKILYTGKNVNINGNIGTNNPGILFGNKLINGNITLGPDATAADITEAESSVVDGKVVNVLTSPIIYPEINDNLFTVSLPNNTTSIDTRNASTQLIDGKLYRKINAIDIGGNSVFSVSGGGDVHILVTDRINVSGTATIRTYDNTRLFVYYDNADTIVFNGTVGSMITLYAPNATINFNGGGHGSHIGSFICKTFQGPNSNNCTITQGNGTMADLALEGAAGYIRAVWSD